MTRRLKNGLLALAAGLLSGLMSAVPALADDTEIYFTAPASGLPNVLFMLDGSGSMALAPNGTMLPGGGSHYDSRYQVMKRALTAVLLGSEGVINAGLIHYAGHRQAAVANGVKYPIKPLDETVRNDINDRIADLNVQGYTPIVQSLYEATQYFRGGKVDYGATTNPAIREADPLTYGGGKSESTTSTTVTAVCNEARGECTGKTITGTCTEKIGWCNSTTGDCTGLTLTGTCNNVPEQPESCKTVDVPNKCVGGYDEAGNCMAWDYKTETVCDAAQPAYQACEYRYNECPYTYDETTIETLWNANYDSPIRNECQPNFIVLLSDGEPNDGIWGGSDPNVVSKITGEFGLSCAAQPAGLEDGRCGPELTKFLATKDQNPTLANDQFVNTFAIGFALGNAGESYLKKLANLGPELEKEGKTGFFSAKDEEQLVAALYEIMDAVSDTANTFAPPAIALDQTTRLENSSDVFLPMFRPGRLPRWIGNVKKYQLSQPDATGVAPKLLDASGKDALNTDGKFNDTARSFWLTGAEPDGGEVGKGGVAHLLGTKRSLWTENGTNMVSLEQKNVTYTDLGLPKSDKTLEKALIDYITGKKKGDATTPRRSMGDVLHSRPVMVSYANGTTALFVGTNEGYLHGFDTKTGAELFAFMPRELLKNVKTLYDNKYDPTGNRPYGMDGPITVWLDDKNNDGKIDGSAGEKAYLFAGMRRGGRGYYALNITKPDSPKLLWSIQGGSGDFAALGQSWSAAVPTEIEIEPGNRKPAVIFSGGYDPDQDNAASRIDDSEGNAVFIVNAESGELIWEIEATAMPNSIPASPRVIDIDNNGVADRIYFNDVVGRVYRVDLPDSKNRHLKSAKEPTLKQIADLGGNDVTSNRRFFNEPDAAIVRLGTQRYVSLAIGSGFRERPLQKSTIQDRLFMVKDLDVAKVADPDRALIGESDLVNVDTSQEIPQEKFGWYYNLEFASGEKALARAVTVDNKVFFTTFLPETESSTGCGASRHSAKIYAFDVRTAKAVVKYTDFEADPTKLTDADRVVIGMPTSDILPEVHFNVRKDGDTGKVIVETFIGGKFDQFLGRQQFESLRRVYWEQEH